MNVTKVIVDDPLASHPSRSRPALVERRDGDRVEMLTPSQAQRYDLMCEAVRALLEARVERPETNWVAEMAPLNKRERRGVLADAFRRARELEA